MRYVLTARERRPPGRKVWYDGIGWTLLAFNAHVYAGTKAMRRARHAAQLVADLDDVTVTIETAPPAKPAKRNPQASRRPRENPRRRTTNGILEISGADLADLRIEVDEHVARDLAEIAARRARAERNRKAGMSVRTSRAAASDAKPSAEMLKIVRAHLRRGASYEAAIRAAIRAANLYLLKNRKRGG